MGEIQEISSRRLSYINNNLLIPVNENVLVIDNGCDQTIVNISAFFIKSFVGI